ncbi:hypothetical protein MPSEU_000211100 [Mayamaea pseudoterrestris]|nr:hypothetical protein MPSEU_000211100 [Mayamaea pseudoterrestris]
MGWRERMEKAKRDHRPELKDWGADRLWKTFPAWRDALNASPSEEFKSFQFSHDEAPRNYPIILDARILTVADFHENYEAKEYPCLIKNIPAGYEGGSLVGPWKAVDKWRLEALKKDEGIMNRKFKCGEDDDGDNIRVRLSHFMDYMEHNKDDSPLYVFDSGFDEDKAAKSLLLDYRVPSYFRHDLFGLVKESRRPPYRWWLVGPERSGTCIHIDPLATNAWNTLIVGQKRWCLFPPHVRKSIYKGKGLVSDDEDDEAIHFFMTILPRIKQEAKKNCDKEEYRNFAVYEFTQNAGETVFVPNGWSHAVLNLTDTVGVTQNFCSFQNFDKVWRKTRSGRTRMAWKWLCTLYEQFPELAERARAMNESDDYKMRYDPVEIQKREDERKRIKKDARVGL